MSTPPFLLRPLRSVDALTIVFLLLLALVTAAFGSTIHHWHALVAIDGGAIIAILLLAYGALATGNGLVRFVHDWYPAPVIFAVFKEAYVIIHSLGRADWDPVLISIDRWIFGTDPTVWLGKFAMPAVTEVLQIAYASYYFILLTVGIELYVRQESQKFSFVLFTILYGFFLSYVGYLVFPAVGPRFTLHRFDAIDTDLPGLWLTNGIRNLLNAGESIPAGMANAMAVAQRDAFPSGHTQMTIIALYFARKYRLASRSVLYVFGTLLIVSTVYLRYHYVIDLIGGVVFVLVTLWTAPKIFAWWEKLRQTNAQTRQFVAPGEK